MQFGNGAARALVAVAIVLLFACAGQNEPPVPNGHLDRPFGGRGGSSSAGSGGSVAGTSARGGEGGGGGAPDGLLPYGIEQRPENPGCRALNRPTGEPGDPFPKTLSATTCVEADDPFEPRSGLIEYDVNAPLYSDGASKRRWLALPDGDTIAVGVDGDLDLPVGSVLMKRFSLGDTPVETRLLMRHADGEWAGYSYAWRADGSDADLLETTLTRTIAGQDWTYPSRENCLECHTDAAGRSLGLEIGQLNRTFDYPLGRSEQLRTFEHLGLFTSPLPSSLAFYPPPAGSLGDPEERARAYLHANCSQCHRPGGVTEVTLDLRYQTPLAEMRVCDVEPGKGNFGLVGAKLLKPGDAALSMLSFRMRTSIAGVRMPPLGRTLPDTVGIDIVQTWVAALDACP